VIIPVGFEPRIPGIEISVEVVGVSGVYVVFKSGACEAIASPCLRVSGVKIIMRGRLGPEEGENTQRNRGEGGHFVDEGRSIAYGLWIWEA